jgi:hypothetical protein
MNAPTLANKKSNNNANYYGLEKLLMELQLDALWKREVDALEGFEEHAPQQIPRRAQLGVPEVEVDPDNAFMRLMRLFDQKADEVREPGAQNFQQFLLKSRILNNRFAHPNKPNPLNLPYKTPHISKSL